MVHRTLSDLVDPSSSWVRRDWYTCRQTVNFEDSDSFCINASMENSVSVSTFENCFHAVSLDDSLVVCQQFRVSLLIHFLAFSNDVI